ncbi:hypothetical protein BDZ94DRAFT_1308541 [Collybia nuda]|uniref:Uncharacterized protein n=1 Tax=Collybia nuda TaxID=64659 RepID=A0A9P6CK97_9AGAR|nr:hypothetical protein BDZ94DRAFT_1308541 [Collybia nuda]
MHELFATVEGSHLVKAEGWPITFVPSKVKSSRASFTEDYRLKLTQAYKLDRNYSAPDLVEGVPHTRCNGQTLLRTRKKNSIGRRSPGTSIKRPADPMSSHSRGAVPFNDTGIVSAISGVRRYAVVDAKNKTEQARSPKEPEMKALNPDPFIETSTSLIWF